MFFEGDCMGGFYCKCFFSVWICNFFANVLEFWLGDGGDCKFYTSEGCKFISIIGE